MNQCEVKKTVRAMLFVTVFLIAQSSRGMPFYGYILFCSLLTNDRDEQRADNEMVLHQEHSHHDDKLAFTYFAGLSFSHEEVLKK
jgi:hypothetical protein